MTVDHTLVLLHGAGTGAWVWERVIPLLPMRAIALDVPGRTVDATPDRCASELVAELDRRGVGPVILVLHSLAGVLALGLSTRLASRLRGCIFLSAVIPQSGCALVDTLGFPNRLILRVLFKLNPKGLKPSPAMIRRTLCNDLTGQDAEMVVRRYEAEMPGLYLAPVGAPAALPACAYVKLMKDRSVSLAQQHQSVARLASCRVHEIDAGHLVMLSAPSVLAEILSREVSNRGHS